MKRHSSRNVVMQPSVRRIRASKEGVEILSICQKKCQTAGQNRRDFSTPKKKNAPLPGKPRAHWFKDLFHFTSEDIIWAGFASIPLLLLIIEIIR